VVDLRWGITREQADNAETLRICLNELTDSDIFIGMYGRRYGSCFDPRDPSTTWIKDNFSRAEPVRPSDCIPSVCPPAARLTLSLLGFSCCGGLQEYPWVTTFLDKAVTEVEFRHGFLNNPTAVRQRIT
jgi:hypothetical protein